MEGMVLCIRPSLAIGIHASGHTSIDMLGHTIRVCEGGRGRGRETKLQTCSCMYTYIEPCACVCGRNMQILLVGFSKSDCMPRPFAELVTCTYTISCIPTTGFLRSMQL